MTAEHEAIFADALRAELTPKTLAAVIDAVDNGDFGDASGHLGCDGFQAIADAAVQVFADFIEALGLTEETRSPTDPREVWYGAPIEVERRFVTPWEAS